MEVARELGAPAGATFDGLIFNDLTDDKDFARRRDLMPDGL